MKIVTVNLPVSDIKLIKNLVGENGLYPSRSELIRVAIRDFLVKEIHVAKNFFPQFKEPEPKPSGDENIVNIPENDSWKTYNIISREEKISGKKKPKYTVDKNPLPEINNEPDVNLIMENRAVRKLNGNPLGNKFHPEGIWRNHHC